MFRFFGRTVAVPVLQAASKAVGLAFRLADPWMEQRIPRWSLDNDYLVFALGYLAGFLDCAYQSTAPKRYDERAVDRAYKAAMEHHFANIPGIELVIKVNKLAGSGSSIAGMQHIPAFMRGQVAGGTDYMNFWNDKRMPLSLAKEFGGTELAETGQQNRNAPSESKSSNHAVPRGDAGAVSSAAIPKSDKLLLGDIQRLLSTVGYHGDFKIYLDASERFERGRSFSEREREELVALKSALERHAVKRQG